MNDRNNKSSMENSKSFEEAISFTGFGKFNLYALLAIGGSLMCVMNETLAAMFITPAAQCDLNLSLTEKGILYSAGFLGVVASSQIWGYIADTRGRKIVLITSLIISATISIVGSLVNVSWLFILLRFFNGFFVGGSSAISYAYIGEFHDIHYRSKVVSWAACFIALGNMYLPGMAWLVLPHHWSHEVPGLGVMFKPWRLLVVVYAIPSIFVSLLLILLPESPKYLIAQGKKDEVLLILKKMYVINTGKGTSTFPATEIKLDGSILATSTKNYGFLTSFWRQTKPLFQKAYIVKTALVCYLQYTSFFGSSAVMMWYPQILNMMSEYEKKVPDNEVTMCKSIISHSNSNATATTICSDSIHQEAFIVSLIVGCSYLVCYIFMGSVINFSGPRTFAVGLVSITTISGISAQVVSGYTYIQFTIGFFLMGAITITAINALVVELYPTQIRGMALSISAMFARLGAMTGSNVVGPLIYSFCDYLFYIFAAINISFIICLILVPSQNSTKKKELSQLKLDAVK